MEINYFCNNEKCENLEKKPFFMALSVDAIMDEKNVADLFCPHCKKPLIREKARPIST